MEVGFFVIVTALATAWIAREVHNHGYQKGREFTRIFARAEVEAYKAEQVWEYDPVEEPLVRRNRLTGELEQRFVVGNMISPGLTSWRKVINNRSEDHDKDQRISRRSTRRIKK